MGEETKPEMVGNTYVKSEIVGKPYVTMDVDPTPLPAIVSMG